MKLNKTNTNFLKRLGATVFAYSNGKVDMHYVSDLESGMVKNTRNASDLYFIANPSTGMKEKSVTALACNFVDLDAGRPTETSYHPLHVVNDFKRKVMRSVASSEFIGLKPTYIVETRNGYHLYWVYDKHVTISTTRLHDWKLIEKYLTARFAHLGADPYVVKPNQLLRVPGSYWHKAWEGNSEYSPFMATIVPTKKARQTYKFTSLLAMAKAGVDAITAAEPILSEARTKSSYTPTQDVNSSTRRSPNPIYKSQYSVPQSRKMTPIDPTPRSNVEYENEEALYDIVAYLRAQNLNHLANKLETYIQSN